MKGTVRTETPSRISEGEIRIPDLPGAELRQGLSHDAYARLSWSNGYYNISYHISLGGSTPCTEKDFWSGDAHKQLIEHLAAQADPLIEYLETEWLEPKVKMNQQRVDNGGATNADMHNMHVDGTHR